MILCIRGLLSTPSVLRLSGQNKISRDYKNEARRQEWNLE